MRVKIADGRFMRQVVVRLKRIEGHLEFYVAVREAPVKDLRDVDTDLACHYYINMQRGSTLPIIIGTNIMARWVGQALLWNLI